MDKLNYIYFDFFAIASESSKFILLSKDSQLVKDA